jgi:hypothetical protein
MHTIAKSCTKNVGLDAKIKKEIEANEGGTV